MRTTVDLPADLMATAMELSPGHKKREMLTAALEEHVKRLFREQLRCKRGTGFIDLTQEELEQTGADG